MLLMKYQTDLLATFSEDGTSITSKITDPASDEETITEKTPSDEEDIGQVDEEYELRRSVA